MQTLALHGGKPVFDSVLDFRSFWPPIDDATERRLLETYRSRKWTAFDNAEPAFAQSFAELHGAKYGIFTINGTVTLQIALQVLGVGPGDEVIVPPLTWYATAIAVAHVGATPVFVDVEPDTLCIDPARIERAITERTKAIIPVHAYHSMADMDRVMAVARKHGLRVIEDCAHMHGGKWNGQGVGTLGDIGSFSFQNTKTMSSGEGGICITNDAGLADRLFRTKQIGYGRGELPRQAKSGPPVGLMCYNYRATAFHPIVLEEQLKNLETRLDGYQRRIACLEDRLKRSTQIRFQSIGRRATRQGCFGWVMLFDDPAYDDVPIELIQKALVAEGVPVLRAEGPIYRFILFNLRPEQYRIDLDCQVTERACARILWILHGYFGLDDEFVEKMADAIEKVAGNIGALRTAAAGRA